MIVKRRGIDVRAREMPAQRKDGVGQQEVASGQVMSLPADDDPMMPAIMITITVRVLARRGLIFSMPLAE